MELTFVVFLSQYKLVDFINKNDINKENIQNIIYSDKESTWTLFYWE